jgi:hypothetical protein
VIIDAKNKLDAEISRLETLYYVSTILYGKEMREKYKQSPAKQALPVTFRSAGWEREVAHNAGHFRVIVEKNSPPDSQRNNSGPDGFRTGSLFY